MTHALIYKMRNQIKKNATKFLILFISEFWKIRNEIRGSKLKKE